MYTFERSNKVSFVIVVMVIVALLLQGCAAAAIADGNVVATQGRTAAYVILHAQEVLQNGSLFMYIRQMEGGYAFVVIDADNRLAMKALKDANLTGNMVNSKTMTDLISTLKNYGWDNANPKDMGPVVQAIAQAAGAALVQGASSWTTFVVMFGNDIPAELQPYMEVDS